MATLSQRLYDSIVGVLPYVVLAVGVLSVALGGYALLFSSVSFWTALLNVGLGGFLLWSGFNVLRDRRQRDGDEPDA